MGKFTNIHHAEKSRSYLLQHKLKVLYSYRIDFFFISLLLILSIFYFRHTFENDTLLLFGQVGHGDLRYALTVQEHFNYHLENIPVHAAKLPLLSILYPLQIALGDLLAEKVFTMLCLFLAATLVYLANKQFVQRFEGKRGYLLSASCFVGSLVLMYNPWTINKIHHHYWLVLSLAASYLLIAVIDSYLHSKQRSNTNRLILMAFSTSLVATQLQSAVIYLLPMLIIYLAVSLIFHRSTILSKYAAKKIATLVIVITACNLFWLVPVIQLLTADSMSQGMEFLNFEPSEGFVTSGVVEENVEELSRRATIRNVLEGTGAWLWGGDGSQDASIKINNIDLWQGLALLPLIFVSLFFIIKAPIKKDIIYIVIFFSALIIISVILATGSYYNNLYTRFFLDFPLGESIRDPYKFSGLYFVAISFFASASIYRIDTRSLRKNIAIILLMVGLILSWGWIGLTGDLNGHMTESAPPYPHDLSDVTEYLLREYGFNNNLKDKIFWYPAGGERSQLHYSSVPELSTESLPQLKLSPFQLDYINDLIKKNNTSVVSLLEYLGVQYLVIREDFVDNYEDAESESLQEMQMRVQNLETILHKNMVFESGRFEVYKLNTTSLASVSHAISAGTDDLYTIGRVAEKSEHLNKIELGPFLEDSLIISDGLPPEPPRGAITIIDPTSKHYSPMNYWSTGSINGGWLNTIRPHLDNYGINTWQFDYNRGFIFTWGEKYIPSNYNLENAKTLTTFYFDSSAAILQWQNNDPKNQLLGIRSNAMIISLNSSNYGWKTITSPAIGVAADGAYILDLHMRYYNAEGVHLKVTEYNKDDSPVGDAIVQNIGTGTSDWKDITFSYMPSSKEVTTIKLSIWHGHLTKQPLPNVLLIDSVRMYDISDQLVDNNIDVPIKVGSSNNNDQYKVFVRYLESPQGGLVNAALEGGTNLMQISTLSPYSRFVWKDLGEYTLSPGSHTMTFTNGGGFNAINAILLIQKDQFDAIKGQIEDWLNQNSTTIIRIFEAESDMNTNDTTMVDDIASGNDNIVLINTTAWTHFNVKKEGDYRIWIEGSGTFTVIIDDQKKIMKAAMNGPTLSEPFRLKEGQSRLEITPLQELEKLKIPDHQSNNLAGHASNSKGNNETNVIDSIWIVSDGNNNRLYQLLDEGKNDSSNQTQLTTSISNNMWSSQKYEIKLNNITTTRPLMISLAEPFNPDLKAAIYTKDGGLSKVENLIPLFYALKSGIYLDSLPADGKVVIYDARVPIGWLFVISSFISLTSYVLLPLSTNVRLTNRFKGFVYNLNHLMKQKISPKKNNNKGYDS